MNIKNLLSTKLVLSGLVLTVLILSGLTPVSAVAELSEVRKQELSHLLKHDCGSCHGMTLKGGLGPALLASNLHDKDDEFLMLTIQHGRPGTPMPPWKSQLSTQEIRWIITLLRQQ